MKVWLKPERWLKAGRHSLVLGRAMFLEPQRRLVWLMLIMSRSLPARFERPLPAMMADLTPPAALPALPPADICRLTDAVAAWHITSPLGLCLRRSLLRYYFLRQAGLPVVIVFGARLKTAAEGSGLGGHAWLTLNGVPYRETPADYQGFTPMYTYGGP